MKTRLSESEAEAEEQPIVRPGIELWDFLIFLLATLTVQFLLERKRRSHKRNQCSASNYVGFIFTRSYCSNLLTTTSTRTSSLVIASLKRAKNCVLPKKDLS